GKKNMLFDESMVAALRSMHGLLNKEDALYLARAEELAAVFTDKQRELEDIIYDFEEAAVRIEAMNVCKLMLSMDRDRIYRDLWLAEKDSEVKNWSRLLLGQEIANRIAADVFRERKKPNQPPEPTRPFGPSGSS